MLNKWMNERVYGIQYIAPNVFLYLEILYDELWGCVTLFSCYLPRICSFRPPASTSHPSTDLGLFLLLLTVSPLLQTGHHFLFFLLLQPRCMLGRWPTGTPSSLEPPGRDCNDRNLWDQGVRDRRRRATAEEEGQRREQGERERKGINGH